MNEELVTIHAWAASGCLSVAVIGVLAMMLSVVFPVQRKTGDQVFKVGVVISLFACSAYLLYALASLVTVLVIRS